MKPTKIDSMEPITIQEIDDLFDYMSPNNNLFKDDDKTMLEEIAGMKFINDKNRKLFIELMIKGEEGKLKGINLTM